MAQKALSKEEKERIERNRQNALSIRMKKTTKPNSVLTVESLQKNVISVDGVKYIDSQGGFLVKDKKKEEVDPEIGTGFEEDWNPEPIVCKECEKEFLSSYLADNFKFNVCDGCRDEEEKHSLITRTDAKNEYLLKDCDFDLREPPLKFINKKNPHNSRWGEMKLYLLPQVEARALEVHESFEKIEELHKEREGKRQTAKSKKYNKDLKNLRMTVRSSLFKKTVAPSHEHVYGEERYNEEDDTYTKTCKTCDFEHTYEKM
ncbi:hypothetical protein GE061_000318 [Apolygus lucorum]|uniref:XPA C-terminal domain-containing protein n=1 Tax=Apolygus lucorum TaxID=248454 RepID=A0A6A4KKC9_APOLU|nr:hypothetical protein GE061_000318 [Apolygus lucorum]